MIKYFTFLFLALILTACSTDEEEIADNVEEEPVVEEEVPPVGEFLGEVSNYNSQKVQPGYVLGTDAANNRVFIIEKEDSEILYEWKLPSGVGNDSELLSDGSLLIALKADNPVFNFGGYGGRIAIISPDGQLKWDYILSDENTLAHHDIQMLPNGNVLILAWELKDSFDLEFGGYSGEEEVIYSEKLLEINPVNNEVVWEWRAWDHLVQDVKPSAENFGSVENSPERINVNYVDHLKEGLYNGDIFHANGVEYDAVNDLIFLSVNFFSEVWVIDHSTTIQEARSSKGGNYGKGGDLVYRFGNPAAYNNLEGDRMFYHNHHPNLVQGENNLLVFSNGIPSVDAHSVVYELDLEMPFQLVPNTNNEPEVLWSYRHEELFSAKVSGAVRLPNGNTLITEGTSGYWEVTANGEIVWRFEGDGFFWRGYHLEVDDPALEKLGF
jgi:hypothetical protein